MNNENYDDYLTSGNVITKSKDDFVRSWQLSTCDEPNHITNVTANMALYSQETLTVCDQYFKNRLSHFVECFPIVDPSPFYEMCLDLGLNSISSVIYDDHPSQRGVCTSALAYIDVCESSRTPLRIPNECVQ